MAKKALNKWTAPKSVAPEKIIQFGEGNFLRAFVDWIVWNMNAKTNFNGSVAVVQPIDKGMVEWLNGQDCLYHVNLQGRLDGKAVNSLERIDVISRALNPYTQNWAYMALAEQPEIRFVISNTTEAGITFDDSCKFTDAPASFRLPYSSAEPTITIGASGQNFRMPSIRLIATSTLIAKVFCGIFQLFPTSGCPAR